MGFPSRLSLPCIWTSCGFTVGNSVGIQEPLCDMFLYHRMGQTWFTIGIPFILSLYIIRYIWKLRHFVIPTGLVKTQVIIYLIWESPKFSRTGSLTRKTNGYLFKVIDILGWLFFSLPSSPVVVLCGPPTSLGIIKLRCSGFSLYPIT